MNKNIFLGLSLFSCFTQAIPPANNIISYLNETKQKEVCTTETTKGTSIGAINACADALVADSSRKLNEKIAKVKTDISDFDGPYNEGGGGSREEYIELFNKSQEKWEGYVKNHCELIAYPYGEVASYYNKQFCIAVENYIRIDDLQLY